MGPTRLKRRRHVEQIAVEPLTQLEVAELLAAVYGGPVPLRVAEVVHERSGGNPSRRLCISPKTASVHVSHILTTLGMSSRTEIAAWAVRAGLAD